MDVREYLIVVLVCSFLKEISPGCSLEGLMLKLKLQYFGHLMRRVDSLEKTLSWEGFGAGGEGDNRGWDGWMASPTPWAWVWVNSGSLWWTGRPGVLRFHGVARSQTRLSDWTELNWMIKDVNLFMCFGHLYVFIGEISIHLLLIKKLLKNIYDQINLYRHSKI